MQSSFFAFVKIMFWQLMHQENFLCSWLREDTEDKAEEVGGRGRG